MMLTCKETTRLLFEGQDRALTLAERMHLRLHLMMCSGCTNFNRQMAFLRKAGKRFAAGGLHDDDAGKPPR